MSEEVGAKQLKRAVEAQHKFQFDVGIPGGIMQWTVVVAGDIWRVCCDENERNFASEDAACSYFWERLRMPPSN